MIEWVLVLTFVLPIDERVVDVPLDRFTDPGNCNIAVAEFNGDVWDLYFKNKSFEPYIKERTHMRLLPKVFNSVTATCEEASTK